MFSIELFSEIKRLVWAVCFSLSLPLFFFQNQQQKAADEEPVVISLVPSNYPVILPNGQSTLSDKIQPAETVNNQSHDKLANKKMKFSFEFSFVFVVNTNITLRFLSHRPKELKRKQRPLLLAWYPTTPLSFCQTERRL